MNQANLTAALDAVQECCNSIDRCRRAAAGYAAEGRWDLCRAQLDLMVLYAGSVRDHGQNAMTAASDPVEVPRPCLLQ